jgi:hypothetical protein
MGGRGAQRPQMPTLDPPILALAGVPNGVSFSWGRVFMAATAMSLS